VSKQQSAYINWKKNNLLDKKVLVQCDFNENYTFIIQEAAQAFHYNNNQASIHTAVYYYKMNDEVCHDSLAIISDDLTHNTVAVYAQQLLIEDLEKRVFLLKNCIFYRWSRPTL
jgi:hypothetical protein